MIYLYLYNKKYKYKMRIQYASDLHIDYIEKQEDIDNLIQPSDSDILVLAGDIGSLYKYTQLKNFISNLNDRYKVIFYIPGNHEFYTIKDIEPLPLKILFGRLYQLEKHIPNLYILNRSSIKIKNYCFIGSILWSYIPEDKIYPYFRVRIKDFNKFLYNKHNYQDIMYINNMIEICQKEKLTPIIITHYPPSYKCLNKKNENDKYQYLYGNNLDDTLKYVPYWICGHVHWNFQLKINNCLVLANQNGRKYDNITDYSPTCVINV